MSVRRLAWPLFGLWIALAVAAIVLQTAVGDAFNAAIAPVLAVLAAVGLLLWLRRPENTIGPILLALAILITFSIAAEGIYRQWDGDPTPPLAVRVLVALDETFGLRVVRPPSASLLPLLFPTGRLPSPRWRLVLWSTGAVVALADGRHRPRPRTPRLGDARRHRQSARASAARPASSSVRSRTEARWPSCSSSSPRSRGSGSALRRSSGVERQQLKWIVLALAAAARRPGPGRMWRHVRVGAGGQRRLVGVHGGADRRHARRDGPGDPPLPALRHRPRDPAHAGVRRADADARRAPTSAAGAADRAGGRPLGVRHRGLDAGGRRAVPARRARGSRARSTAASTAAATTPPRRSRRSGRTCATSSTSRRWPPTSARSCATPSSPRTSRCG